MQEWMQQFQSDDPPSADIIEAALVDFGYYHAPKDAKRMYAELTNHHLLGYAGGVLDQPDEYWDDMATMQWLSLWVKHVAPMPRMQQTSVFDTLRSEERLDGSWLNNGE